MNSLGQTLLFSQCYPTVLYACESHPKLHNKWQLTVDRIEVALTETLHNTIYPGVKYTQGGGSMNWNAWF